jgi:very-short-patch-repair endonuclease
MLVIEVDGGQHVESVRDDVRTAFLNARGYSVLRFWNNEVSDNLNGCWLAIEACLRGSPSPGWRYSPAALFQPAIGRREGATQARRG